MYKNKNAFTLAEMMVVMLILTIILAAFAPLMTKRKNVDISSSPWKYASNNSDIYYGLGGNQTAMIGQNAKTSTDTDSKLIINTSSTNQAHITFKTAESGEIGSLLMQVPEGTPGDLRMGGPYKQATINAARGTANTGFGFYSLNQLKQGDYNSALGWSSLGSNTDGSANTALGTEALRYNTTGSDNTAIGANALRANKTGEGNIAIGSGALDSNENGTSNIAIGVDTVWQNVSGDYNIGIGYSTFNNLIEGSHNIGLGTFSCQYVTGSNKTCIGERSGPANGNAVAADQSKVIYLGTEDTTVYIPGNLIVGNQTFLGTSMPATRDITTGSKSSLWVRMTKGSGFLTVSDSGYKWLFSGNENGFGTDYANAPTWVQNIDSNYKTLSDKRMKNIKSENKNGLEAIRELKVYNYTFKNDKDKTPQVGVMAQDLQEVFPDGVSKGEDGYLRIRWDDMFYAVINSVKQLDNFVQGIINELKVHFEKLTALDNRIKVLEQENKLLKEQIADMNKRLEKLEK